MFDYQQGRFSLRHNVQTGSGTHPASYAMGTRVISSGEKRPRHEADHSPPSSAEVKNAWSCTSTPTFVCMAWCLVKYQRFYHITKSFLIGSQFSVRGRYSDTESFKE
jgi:hypothetical protein